MSSSERSGLYEAAAATSPPMPFSALVDVIAHHAGSLAGASHVAVVVSTTDRQHGCQLDNGVETPLDPAIAEVAMACAAGPAVLQGAAIAPVIRRATGGQTALVERR